VTVRKFFGVTFVTGFLALFCKGFGFGVVRPDSGTVERLRVVWLLPSGAKPRTTERATKVTRKHYEKVAQILRQQVEQGADKATVAEIATELVSMFRADNPRFCRDRFFSAIGYANEEWAI
jgi:hypothetical protein